ncbi:MAG: hypothetical protein WC618_04520 [Patescibacteria group bacterium]
MKLYFNGQYSMNPAMLLRRCGYGQIATRETSYARRFSRQEYPRFHVYIDKTFDGFAINLHLDQKKPSYGKQTSHSGEYNGELVEREAQRIKQIVETFIFYGTATG